MARLQLQYNQEFDRYILRDPYTTQGDESYEMVINHECGGEYSFRFLVWEDGEWFEMITKADYDRRVQDIRDHEGDEVADIWVTEQEGYRVVREDHPVFKLQRRW